MQRKLLAIIAGSIMFAGMAHAAHPNYVLRLKTDLHGLPVKVDTMDDFVAIVHFENRSSQTVFCSVGFFDGGYLRARYSSSLNPSGEWFAHYPVAQELVALPVTVICDSRKEALPYDKPRS